MAISNNPDARMPLIVKILDSLFAPDNRRMQKWRDKLILMNNEAIEWKTDPNCFQHRGVRYMHSTLPTPPNITKIGIPVLHRDLLPEIEKFIDEREQLSNDWRRIEQFLVVLFRPLNTAQDMRDAIPDCLARHASLNLERQFPQELVWKPTGPQMKEYEKLLPTIKMYDGASLLL